MRRLISQHQKYQALSRVLDSYATVRHPKQEVQQQFLEETMKVIGMGILLATRLENNALLLTLKQYQIRLGRIGAFKQYQASIHIIDELEVHSAAMVDIGLTSELWSSYKALSAAFGEMLDETDDKLGFRRLRRKEARKLISACYQIVRLQLDPFVKFHKRDHSMFYEAYFGVRGVRAHHRYVRAEDLDLLVEIIGTVTDGVTGLPVAGAVVNLIGLEMTTETDVDGVYSFDELPSGSLVVSCYRQDYELPEQVSMVAQAGETLEVNFVLTPAVGVPVAS